MKLNRKKINMKKIIKNNIIAFILSSIVFGSLGAYAATVLNSSEVYYNNTNSGGISNTVSGAIDELYIINDKIKEEEAKCPDDMICVDK